MPINEKFIKMVREQEEERHQRYNQRREIWDKSKNQGKLPEEFIELASQAKCIEEGIKNLNNALEVLMKQKYHNEIKSGKVLFDFFKDKPEDALFEYIPPTGDLVTNEQILMDRFAFQEMRHFRYIPASYELLSTHQLEEDE